MTGVDLAERIESRILGGLPTTTWVLDHLYRTGQRKIMSAETRAARTDAGLSILHPSSLRRTDTAVVLASGPSARAMSDQSLAGNSALDFFVLNHASALPVPGRLYSIEDPVLKGRQGDISRSAALDLIEWSIRRGRALPTGAPVVIRGSWHEPGTQELASRMSQLGAQVIVAPRFALTVRGRRGPERYARWANHRQPFKWPQPTEAVLSPRGGLGFLVSLCISLGYPSIVLAGVDMYSDDYFFDVWDEPELAKLGAQLRPPSASPHLTSKATRRRPSVRAVLVALHDGYLRPRGRALLVGSKSSLLFPDLSYCDLAAVARC